MQFARVCAAKQGNVYNEDAEHIPMMEQLSNEGADRLQSHLDVGPPLCGMNGCYVYDVMQSSTYCTGGWQFCASELHAGRRALAREG